MTMIKYNKEGPYSVDGSAWQCNDYTGEAYLHYPVKIGLQGPILVTRQPSKEDSLEFQLLQRNALVAWEQLKVTIQHCLHIHF